MVGKDTDFVYRREDHWSTVTGMTFTLTAHTSSRHHTVDRIVHIEAHPTWLPVLTDPTRLTILFALTNGAAMTVSALSKCCHTSERAIRSQLETLAGIGLVQEQLGERDGLTPGRPPTRFTLDPHVRGELKSLLAVVATPLAPAPE